MGRVHVWYRGMSQDGFIDPSAVALIQSSWISDYTRRRIGAFIDFTSPARHLWLSELAQALEVNPYYVPLYFYFETDPAACLKHGHPWRASLYDSARQSIETRLALEKEARMRQEEVMCEKCVGHLKRS